VEVGDVVLGLASDGIHSNGYSLVRKVVKEAGLELGRVYPELEEKKKFKVQSSKFKSKAGRNGHSGSARTLGEALLTPTRIYVKPILKLLSSYKVKKVIGGMAHITGSGMSGNLCRALHPGVDAVIDTTSWPVPAVFRFLQERGGVDEGEMRRVFNMGIGYCLVVRPAFASAIKEHLTRLGERVYQIGVVERGTGVVREV
ncbi:MAG: hypothetical protein K2Q09_09800, partial [Phycisphaerales bacterium]|nr:hypothetical protein [Phycisphaerales bacterium]